MNDLVEKFSASVAGVAALEFALVAPILLTLFIGSVEFSQALTLDRRVTTAASSIADLVAQAEVITEPELDDIMGIAESLLETALISQFNPGDLSIQVVSVLTDANNNATVGWSYDKAGGQPYAAGSTYSGLPAGLLEPLSSVIIATVAYDFTPEIGQYISGTIELEETFYLRPRRSLSVTKTD